MRRVLRPTAVWVTGLTGVAMAAGCSDEPERVYPHPTVTIDSPFMPPVSPQPDPAVASRHVTSETFFPRVEDGQFIVFDEEQWPESLPDFQPGVQALPGGFVVGTTATDFYPAVTLTTDASLTPEGWEAAGSAAFRVVSGSLLVRSLMQDPAGTFALRPGEYVVRAFTRGGQQALARGQEELFFRGTEEWLLVLHAEG